MALSAIERIDTILAGRQIHPFDWFNHPIFMDPRPEPGTEYTKRLTDSAKVAYVAANEMGYGLEFLFRPSAMSNGERARSLVNDCEGEAKQGILSYGQRRFGRPIKTTQNLKNTVAGSELMNRVILPNREADFHAGNVIESRFPKFAAVYPIAFENAIRTQKANNALSQGATFQDWTFESWWVPRVLDMSCQVMDGHKRYDSRYLGLEDLEADMIQAGFVDEYRTHVGPGREFDVTDRNGTHVPLADRAWGRAKHVFEWTEDDFAADLGAGVLLAQFMLDDWLRGDGAPEGFAPIDRQKLHPVLADRTPEELARMDRLKKIMLPYIAEKCLDLIPYNEDPNLKKYVEEKVIPARGDFSYLDMAAMREELFSEPILGDLNNSDVRPRTGVSAKFDVAAVTSAKPAKRRDTDGGYFENPARLFDDGHFDKLSVWEQAALGYLMGAMESFRLPESTPRSAFYSAEPKGGARARQYMKKQGIDFLKEAYAAGDPVDGDDSFAREVIAPNMADTERAVERIAGMKAVQSRGVRNIVSTNNFIRIFDAVEKFRDFVAAKGAQKLSPRAKLALKLEYLDRNPEELILQKDWQVHHDDVQLAVRALQIATGLVKRPYNGGDYKMRVYADNGKALKKLDLHDLVMTLGRDVDSKLSRNPPPEAREHYLAMARMIQILDMYMDPGRMNYSFARDRQTGATEKHEIIRWRELDDQHLIDFWHSDPQKRDELISFRNHIREKLLTLGVTYMDENDLKGLHEDYAAAWHEARGLDASERRRRYEGRQTFQEWKGPT